MRQSHLVRQVLGTGEAVPRGEAASPTPANGAAGHPDFDVFMPRRRGPGADDGPGADKGPGAGPVPAEAGSAAASYVSSPPYAGSAPYSDQPAPFPGWTGRSAAGGSATPGVPAPPGAPAGPTTPMTPVASPRPGRTSGPPWELSRQTGPLPAIPADGDPGGRQMAWVRTAT